MCWLQLARVLVGKMSEGCLWYAACGRVLRSNAGLSFGWKLRQMGEIAKSSKMVFRECMKLVRSCYVGKWDLKKQSKVGLACCYFAGSCYDSQ